jgi:hypothetical protein
VITAHPVNRSVCPGASTTFAVTASGTGSLSYRWQRNGIDLSDGGHLSGATGPTLAVSSVDRSDEAGYRCIVTDNNGQVSSYSAGLMLRAPTVIRQQPQPQTAHPALGPSDRTFAVEGIGDGAVSYRWQWNQQDLADGPHFSGSGGPTLSVLNIDSSVRGNYRCRVTSGCGSVYSTQVPLSVISADLDGDGDADQADFALLQLCFGDGPVSLTRPECLIADLDNEDHIDVADVGAFLDCTAGSNLPLPPGC